MGEITLRKALDDYRTVYMPYRNFAERTRVEYQNDLVDLVSFLEKSGTNKVGELGLPQIARYFAELENRGFAGATRKRKTVTVRSFLKFLYDDGYINSNLAKKLIPPFTDSKLPVYLTAAEYNRLRKACAGNVRDAAVIELLLQTGIRLSELTRLKIDDIDLDEENSFVRVTGSRGREERILPLNAKASEALKFYLAERSNTQNTSLFLNRFDDQLGERGVQKMLKKYLKDAGLENVGIHTLRHTFGTQHAIKGTNIKTLKEVMGHKDLRSTSVYISLAREVVTREMQKNSL